MENFVTSKIIEVVPYDPNWPKLFEIEAAAIRQVLGENAIAIHHIGSTSVPGLLAKPKIDIIAEVKNGSQSITPLEKTGFSYKGEWNIPFKYGFTKRGNTNVNLHVFEEGHPEIELNLVFRDHLRANPQALKEYAELKKNLLSIASSFQKQERHLFSGYNLGKDAFIRKVLKVAEFDRLRFLKCTHYEEWEAYHHIVTEQIFDPIHVAYDRNHPSITAENHFHFVLSKGTVIVTVAHVEFLNENEAALRSLATDENYKRRGFGKVMMDLLEKWLKQQGKTIIKIRVTLRAEQFYRKLGYIEMPFNDPEGHQGSACDIVLGKKL